MNKKVTVTIDPSYLLHAVSSIDNFVNRLEETLSEHPSVSAEAEELISGLRRLGEEAMIALKMCTTFSVLLEQPDELYQGAITRIDAYFQAVDAILHREEVAI